MCSVHATSNNIVVASRLQIVDEWTAYRVSGVLSALATAVMVTSSRVGPIPPAVMTTSYAYT